MATAQYLAALSSALGDPRKPIQPVQGGNIARGRQEDQPDVQAMLAALQPSHPGLTGADLELAHAQRGYDTADKIAQTASHDAWSTGMPRSAIGPALVRGQQAVGDMGQSTEDEMNIRRLIAALGQPRR